MVDYILFVSVNLVRLLIDDLFQVSDGLASVDAFLHRYHDHHVFRLAFLYHYIHCFHYNQCVEVFQIAVDALYP